MQHRRTALIGMLAGAAGLAGVKRASASVPLAVPPDARGLLYDTTLCIGCKACVSACHEANNLDADRDLPGALPRAQRFERPGEDGDQAVPGRRSAVLLQGAMHALCRPCLHGACMLGALSKRRVRHRQL